MNYKEIELKNSNFVKIIAMLTVVLYHSMAFYCRGGWFNKLPAVPSLSFAFFAMYLNSIHIYTFMFVSGYLFYFLKYEKGKYTDYKKFVKRKALRLLIPCFFTSIFWCIPFYCYFFKGKIVEILKKFLLVMAPAQLWFLVALFVIMCVFYWVSVWLEKRKNKRAYIITLVILYGLCIGSGLIPNVFQIATALRFMLFFYCGYAFRKFDFSWLYKVSCFGYFIIHLALFIGYYYASGFEQGIYHYAGILIYPFVNLSGILMAFIGLNKICMRWPIDQTGRVFQFLKRYNFAIYLFHQQIIYCVISLFSDLMSPVELVGTNFVVAFIASALMASILGRFKLTRFIFGIPDKLE